MYKIIGANQVEYGPVSADQIRAWIAEGRVNTQTLAQAEGETTWKPLSSFPEFATSIPSTPPPAPAPLGAPLLEAEGRNRALASVSGPSIALIIICGLGIALGLLNFLLRMLGMGMVGMNGMNTFEGQNEEVARMMTIYTGVAGMIIQGFAILVGLFIIYGAVKMRRLENHGLSLAACIIAMLPCISPCCCLGLPIGIWGLVVLSKPEVKQYFT